MIFNAWPRVQDLLAKIFKADWADQIPKVSGKAKNWAKFWKTEQNSEKLNKILKTEQDSEKLSKILKNWVQFKQTE